MKDKKMKIKPKQENPPDYKDMKSPKTDPNGSYTGVADDIFEKPTVDVDDL